jgi:tetratricopeptide (TPR) repeat protein
MNTFKTSWRWLLLIFLGLAIYGQTFMYGFVFDDNYFIVNSPFIKDFHHINQAWTIFPKTRLVGIYSFALNYQFNHLNPFGYHVFNFFVHFLAAGLVWATASLLFKLAKYEDPALPFFTALLFLVHPCQTQAISYISQRFESMATVFYLGSIYSYLRARQSTIKFHQALFFAGSMVFAIFGVMTKETAATIPLMILAIEFIFFDFKVRRMNVYFVVAAGLLFFILFMKLVRTDLSIFFHFHPIVSESHDGDLITLKKYLLTQMRVFLTFMRVLVLPIHQNLDYDYPLSTGFINPPLTMLGAMLIGAAVGGIIKLRKNFPVIAFGITWVLITFSINLAPRSNVIFEHKLYLISFGFFLALVGSLSLMMRQPRSLNFFMAILIAALSVASYYRNQVWQNEFTVWNDVVRKSPHKARPYNNLGSAYAQQGNFNQALADYNRSIEINPRFADAFFNRGVVYDRTGDVDHAIKDYDQAIDISPDYADAYNNRGDVFSRMGEYDQAMLDFNKAIAIAPNYAGAYFNRGLIYSKQANFIRAIAEYNKAIQFNPSYADAYYNLGLSYSHQGNYGQALLNFSKASEINPNYRNAMYFANSSK